MRRMVLAAVALGLCLAAGTAAAQTSPSQVKPEYITGGVGYFERPARLGHRPEILAVRSADDRRGLGAE
jgi:hypothetical protein